jgi:predicted nucleic acid-binding protein
MIVLDTDVLSSLTLSRPVQAVIDWLDRQPALSVWTTSVTILEVRLGTALLPQGARRTRLEREVERVLAELIESRVLPFDTAAAEVTAGLMAERRRSGQTGELRDSMIAGIAIARKAMLATRNTRHFAGLPVAVVDPWRA